MSKTRQYTALVRRERDAFVALCPELEIASQGTTVEQARTNLIEAIELFFETASPDQIQTRARGELFVTSVQVTIPRAARAS